MVMNLASTLTKAFQSSSSPKTGCNFNDHRQLKHTVPVPILIQPEDWMQFCFEQLAQFRRRSNPHPARRLDAIADQYQHQPPELFQSSSSPKTGCNRGDFKPADINKFNNNLRDPIIPHIFSEIHIA